MQFCRWEHLCLCKGEWCNNIKPMDHSFELVHLPNAPFTPLCVASHCHQVGDKQKQCQVS